MLIINKNVQKLLIIDEFMTAIEVTLLGTTSAIPTVERNHPSIYVKYTGRNEHCFLFDCGESTQRQIFKANLNFMRIEHIFITHWHADHFAGLFGLIETMSLEKRKTPLHIYGPEAERFVNILLSLGYAVKQFEIKPVNVNFKGSDTETIFENDECLILSVPVKHGVPAVAYALIEKDRIKIDKERASQLGLPKSSPIFNKLKRKGFIIYNGKKIMLDDVCFVEKGKKMVYSGDTKPCENLINIAKNSDLLILDCTYFENIKTDKSDEFENRYHTSLNQALKIAADTNVKQLVLTHISRRYPSQKALEKMVKEEAEKSKINTDIKVAKDFMRIVLR